MIRNILLVLTPVLLLLPAGCGNSEASRINDDIIGRWKGDIYYQTGEPKEVEIEFVRLIPLSTRRTDAYESRGGRIKYNAVINLPANGKPGSRRVLEGRYFIEGNRLRVTFVNLGIENEVNYQIIRITDEDLELRTEKDDDLILRRVHQ